jgi:hypothetical protein
MIYKNIIETKVEAVREMGIKVIAQLHYHAKEPDLMSITNNTAQRSKFIQSVLSIIEKLDMDGLYFSWKWPQCVEVSNV